jgi:hypothetical protein
LATLEGSSEAGGESVVVVEAIVSASIAKIGGLDVGDGSNAHAKETSEHGSRCTDQEGDGGVGERSTLNAVDGEVDDGRKDDSKNAEVSVLFSEEGFGTLRIC